MPRTPIHLRERAQITETQWSRLTAEQIVDRIANVHVPDTDLPKSVVKVTCASRKRGAPEPQVTVRASQLYRHGVLETDEELTVWVKIPGSRANPVRVSFYENRNDGSYTAFVKPIRGGLPMPAVGRPVFWDVTKVAAHVTPIVRYINS